MPKEKQQLSSKERSKWIGASMLAVGLLTNVNALTLIGAGIFTASYI